MTHEQFEKYLADKVAFQRIKTTKESDIKSLNIEWETDISKIDLSVLNSKINLPLILVPKGSIPSVNLKVEWVDMKDLQHRTTQDILTDPDIRRYSSLVALIQSSTKVIPPISWRSFKIVNGDVVFDEISPVTVGDGNHRLALAKYLGLQKVPILFIECLCQVVFDNTLWDCSCKGEIIEMKEKKGDKEFNFFLVNASAVIDEKNYIFDIHRVN
jgi:hypothetical protein